MPVRRQIKPREGGASFSFNHRVFRFFWALVWTVCARYSPAAMHGWRRSLLRLFGAKVAQTAKIYPSAEVWYPPNLEMRSYACLGPRVNCYCMDRVRLNEYALVSQGAHLCAGTHDVDDVEFPLMMRPITIGANAWVAAEAFVGPGVNIGEGAVLGARAVTVRNLEPWMIYAGNPARVIRRRNRLRA